MGSLGSRPDIIPLIGDRRGEDTGLAPLQPFAGRSIYQRFGKAFRKSRIPGAPYEGIIAPDIEKKSSSGLGYPVPVIANSGAEALQYAESTPFDLVLMDIGLKGNMDGIATAQALKSEFKTSVIYITAHADQQTIDRAKQTEPLGYLLKPITDGELRSTVQVSLYRQKLERRVRVSEAWLAATLSASEMASLRPIQTAKLFFTNRVAEKLTRLVRRGSVYAPRGRRSCLARRAERSPGDSSISCNRYGRKRELPPDHEERRRHTGGNSAV